MQLTNVTADPIANIYFDGKVISHTVTTAEGQKVTLGVILPGEYHFDTAAPEKMEIAQGSCRYQLDGQETEETVTANSAFHVPGKSGFSIKVEGEPCHYICSFLAE